MVCTAFDEEAQGIEKSRGPHYIKGFDSKDHCFPSSVFLDCTLEKAKSQASAAQLDPSTHPDFELDGGFSKLQRLGQERSAHSDLRNGKNFQKGANSGRSDKEFACHDRTS